MEGYIKNNDFSKENMMKKSLLQALAILIPIPYMNGAASQTALNAIKLSAPKGAPALGSLLQPQIAHFKTDKNTLLTPLIPKRDFFLKRKAPAPYNSESYHPSNVIDEQRSFKTKIGDLMRTILIEIGRQNRTSLGFAQAILTIDRFFNIGAISSRYDGDLEEMRPGTTAITTAAQRDQTEYVKLLLENGASVNTTNPWNNDTPLMYAARNGNVELVNFLINRGANIHTTNSKGENALICAITDPRKDGYSNLIVVKRLLEAGVSANSADKDWPALCHAADKNNYEVCKLLLAYGADVNTQDAYGYSPLMTAISNGKTDLMKLFLDAGADINLKSKIGRTAHSMAQDYHYYKEIRDEMLNLLSQTQTTSPVKSLTEHSRVQYAD